MATSTHIPSDLTAFPGRVLDKGCFPVVGLLWRSFWVLFIPRRYFAGRLTASAYGLLRSVYTILSSCRYTLLVSLPTTSITATCYRRPAGSRRGPGASSLMVMPKSTWILFYSVCVLHHHACLLSRSVVMTAIENVRYGMVYRTLWNLPILHLFSVAVQSPLCLSGWATDERKEVGY